MEENIINFFHLLATAVWLGGAIFIKIVLNPSLKGLDPQSTGKIMGVISKRFSIIAWICILTLIVTGILKTPSDMYFSFASDMDIYLSLKHIAVIGVVIVGILIAAVVVPKMNKVLPQPGVKPPDEFYKYTRQIERLSLTSTILGVIIVLLAGFLW